MKKKLYFMVLAITIFSISMSSMTSVNSTSPLYGTMDLDWNLGFPGPQNVIPDWFGHVNINGVEYIMAFYNLGNGKPFNHPTGQAHFFGEEWAIYSSADYTYKDGVLTYWNPGTIILSGNDAGVVSISNSLYRMNGAVQIANSPFQAYNGHTVHMSGIINWAPNGAPLTAPGQFRIN